MTAGCTLTDVFACHCSVRLCWNGAFFVRGWLTIRRTFRAFCTEQGKTALLAQWDIERNLPLTPDDVTFGSHKKVWWTCPSGHSWQAMVYTRSEGAAVPSAPEEPSAKPSKPSPRRRAKDKENFRR
ncbi:MAG: zinc-ribbon domain-containing protein [Oscillibacter sp.]